MGFRPSSPGSSWHPGIRSYRLRARTLFRECGPSSYTRDRQLTAGASANKRQRHRRPSGTAQRPVLAWPHDRARGADQAVRREGGGQQPHLRRQTGHRDGLPRPERRRQVHDHADDARPRPAHRRRRTDRRAALRPAQGPAEVHRRAARRQGHARRPQRLQPPALPRAEQRHPQGAGARGPRHGRA